MDCPGGGWRVRLGRSFDGCSLIERRLSFFFCTDVREGKDGERDLDLVGGVALSRRRVPTERVGVFVCQDMTWHGMA